MLQLIRNNLKYKVSIILAYSAPCPKMMPKAEKKHIVKYLNYVNSQRKTIWLKKKKYLRKLFNKTLLKYFLNIEVVGSSVC